VPALTKQKQSNDTNTQGVQELRACCGQNQEVMNAINNQGFEHFIEPRSIVQASYQSSIPYSVKSGSGAKSRGDNNRGL